MLREGGEGLDQPNFFVYEMTKQYTRFMMNNSQICFYFDQFEPSSTSTKELHGRTHRDCKIHIERKRE